MLDIVSRLRSQILEPLRSRFVERGESETGISEDLVHETAKTVDSILPARWRGWTSSCA